METLVTDIQTLIDREAAINKSWSDPLDALKLSHDGTDVDDMIPSVLDRFSHGQMCSICHCPSVGVESKSLGDTVRLCRDVLSAIKLDSLRHRNTTEVCLRCKIVRNPNGVVAGAVHIGMDIVTLTEIIAAGKVFLDSETDIVRIED